MSAHDIPGFRGMGILGSKVLSGVAHNYRRDLLERIGHFAPHISSVCWM